MPVVAFTITLCILCVILVKIGKVTREIVRKNIPQSRVKFVFFVPKKSRGMATLQKVSSSVRHYAFPPKIILKSTKIVLKRLLSELIFFLQSWTETRVFVTAHSLSLNTNFRLKLECIFAI